MILNNMMQIRELIVLAAIACVISAGRMQAEARDASLATGRNSAAFVLLLKPSVQMNPLPGWMLKPAVVQPELATVEIPIPALWQVSTAEFYVLTVVFDDCGDGGPAVEWRSSSGKMTIISPGLGESGKSLGLNARTLLLPQELTREGGVAMISYGGKFDGLVSLAIQPARADSLAVIGAQGDFSLVNEDRQAFPSEEVDGSQPSVLSGDIRKGAIVEAELSSAIEPLEGELEFVVPTQGNIEGAMLRLDVLGLDTEARIEVLVNSIPVGTVGFSAFRLDDPALVPDARGRLILAGWRRGELFIPARLWASGENSIVLSLRRSEFEEGRPIFLKNTQIHLRFGGMQPESSSPPRNTRFGEPDFTLPDPLISDPAESPLPEVGTIPYRY